MRPKPTFKIKPAITKSKNVHQKQKQAKPVAIPKEKFNETIDDIEKEVRWGKHYSERICSTLIHQINPSTRQSYHNSLFLLLEEARLCVLQRDWKNLAHILTVAKPSNREHYLLFPIFVRYAMICLVHNQDKNLMDLFMEAVAGCSGEKDKQMLLNSVMTN